MIWVPDAGTTLRLDLDAWRKYFGFDKNGAYADMDIDVDLDALTMTWSVKGACRGLRRGRISRGSRRPGRGADPPPGPLARVPDAPTHVSIDPRR